MRRMAARLRVVDGALVDDVLWSAPRVTRLPLPSAPTLLYFGGDLQEVPEVMKLSKESNMYLQWNLENTLRSLGDKFPHSNVVVVRPNRMEHGTFSCFDNWVSSGALGVPDHTVENDALGHLCRMLENLFQQLQSRESKAGTDDVPKIQDSPLTLIGFSKGCVVLNQMAWELSRGHTSDPRMRHLIWLDGGHAGGGGAWITERAPLDALARLDAEIEVHVTPYQVCDAKRPWLGREEAAFTAGLKERGARITRTLHSTPRPSLNTHFVLLDTFRMNSTNRSVEISS